MKKFIQSSFCSSFVFVLFAVAFLGSVREGETQTINLMPNGSFEAVFDAKLGNLWGGFPGGQTSIVQETVDEYLDARPVVDTGTAADGRQSLRMDLPARSGYVVASPLVAIVAGQTYVASIALKSTAVVRAKLSFVGTTIEREISIGTNWQRHSLSGVLPQLPEGVSLRVEISAPAENGASAWLDAAQLEASTTASTNYIAAQQVELALRSPRSGSIFHDGESAGIQISTSGTLPTGARLKSSVTDLYGRTQALPDIALPATSLTLPPNVLPQPRGLFRLQSQVFDTNNQPLSALVDVVFARLPRPRQIASEQSYFGVHAPLSHDWLEIAQAIGAHWVRLHDASKISKWRIVEDKPGEFRHLDDGVNLAREMGFAILGMVDGAPPWASISPQATEGYLSMYNLPNAQNALDRWDNYVAEMVGHYAGRINHWEVWNEPWYTPFFPGGIPEQYGELLRRAHAVAKQANPNAVVVGIDTHDSADVFTNRALAASGPSFYDIFSFHEYNANFFGGPGNEAVARVQKFQQMQQNHGTPKPIWITEGGPNVSGASFYNPTGPGRSPREQLAQAIRMDVSFIAAGVKKFFHYTFEINSPLGSAAGIYETLECDRAPRALLVGRAVLASLIDGAQSLGRTDPMPGVEAYSFQQPDGTQVTVLWSYDGQTHTMPGSRGVTTLDAQGNAIAYSGTLTIGAEPIYTIQSVRPRLQRLPRT